MTVIEAIKDRAAWLKRRMGEPSTWTALAGAMVSAAVVPAPMSYACVAVSMMGFFLKEGAPSA